jgi:Na+/pantothenate symporter
VGLFVPILSGLYIRRAGSAEAMGAIVAGVSAAAIHQFVFGGVPLFGFTPSMAGIAAACATFAMLFLFRVGSSRTSAAPSRPQR